MKLDYLHILFRQLQRPLFFPWLILKGCCGQQMGIYIFLVMSNNSKDDLCDLPISTIPTNPNSQIHKPQFNQFYTWAVGLTSVWTSGDDIKNRQNINILLCELCEFFVNLYLVYKYSSQVKSRFIFRR